VSALAYKPDFCRHVEKFLHNDQPSSMADYDTKCLFSKQH